MKTTDRNPQPDPTNAMALLEGTNQTDLHKVHREYCERLGILTPDEQGHSVTDKKATQK